MQSEPDGRLATVYLAWKKHLRVSTAHVARHGPVAENTLRLIARGITACPLRPTLEHVARGLATAPDPPHEVDDQIRRAVLRDLLYASGQADARTSGSGTLLEIALFLALGTEGRGQAAVRLVERLRGMDPEEIDRLASADD